MLTKDEIKAARELCDKATKGPWYDSRYIKAIQVSGTSPAYGRGSFHICRYPTRTDKSLLSHEEWEANAKLIAESRTLVPKLLDTVERQAEAIEVMRTALNYYKAGQDLAELATNDASETNIPRPLGCSSLGVKRTGKHARLAIEKIEKILGEVSE